MMVFIIEHLLVRRHFIVTIRCNRLYVRGGENTTFTTASDFVDDESENRGWKFVAAVFVVESVRLGDKSENVFLKAHFFLFLFSR